MGTAPLLARLLALVWPLAAPAGSPAPGTPVTVRLGPPQRVAHLELSCPAGLVLFDAAGVPLLAGVPALHIRVAAPSRAPSDAAPAPGGDLPSLAPEAPPAPAGTEGAAGGAAPAPEGSAPSAPSPTAPETAGPDRCLLVEYGPAGAAEHTLSLPLAGLEVRSLDPEVPMQQGRRRLRGGLSLQPGADAGLRLTQVLSLEDYVRGVLPGEMSPSAPFEALKAQAVVARTYALGCRRNHAAEGYDLCMGEHCQVYGGVSRENAVANEAVRATEGQVLLWEGRPIAAFYSATCGGATESPADVWGSSDPAPYLAGVPDYAAGAEEDVGAEASVLSLAVRSADVFCGDARDFHWEIERTREELERTFAWTLPAVLRRPAPLGELRALSVAARSQNGRVREVRVEGTGGVYTVRGDGIRRLFGSAGTGRNGLPSTRFVVRAAEDPQGSPPDAVPQRYRILGFGHGHGVGLCQSGAMGMARRGKSMGGILQHYYPGAALGSVTGAVR